MKKSRKFWITLSTTVVLAGATATALGIFIPWLLNKQKLEKLIEEQVKPEEGKGNYLNYELKKMAEDGEKSEDGSLNNMESVVKKALTTQSVAKNINSNVISNYLIQFFKGFKNSNTFTERYEKWEEDINEEWDETVKSYKDKHGGTWEYFFQANVLDPVGGNQDDWLRNKLIDKANSAFDAFLFENYFINALDSNNNILPPPGKDGPNSTLQKYLFSEDLVNGDKPGDRNKIKFMASPDDIANASYSVALADLQEYIFDRYVESETPLVTSMVLFKHKEPLTDSKSDFFNVELAKKILDPNTPSDVVGAEASYTWQAFDASIPPEDNPSGEETLGTTDKYLNFVNRTNDKSGDRFIKSDIGGAINIPAKLYTDDSATLYYVKLSDVFNSSYTQYASASNYLFNELIGAGGVGELPKGKFNTEKNNGSDATEIMGNFFNTDADAAGHFKLPEQVQKIIDKDTKYPGFEASYNGYKSITDVKRIEDTPYLMTRNESGVHIIAIDRFDAISNAAKTGATTQEQYSNVLNEIKNTVLWRYILGEYKMGESTGFTIDLKTEIKTFYDNHRDEILFDYITSKETDLAVEPETYIFSENYTDMDGMQLSKSIFVNYIESWNAINSYDAKNSHKYTVKEKMVDIQSNYNANYLGNSVIRNGIASVLPYERNTNNQSSTDKTLKSDFGTYKTIDIYNPTDTGYKQYSESELSVLKEEKNKTINDLYKSLSEEQKLRQKKLTFSSAQYSQYLLLDSTPTDDGRVSSREYMGDGENVSNAISSWLSSSDTKTVIEFEKMYSDINYGKEELVDDSLNLAGADRNSEMPTDDSKPEVIQKYVNSQLQYSYDVKKKIPLIQDELTQYSDQYLEHNDLLEVANNAWAYRVAQSEKFNEENITYLNDIAAMKKAFDYNETNGQFEFTKFRNFLYNQTSNFKMGVYTWTTTDKMKLISGYQSASPEVLYTHSSKRVSSAQNPYGYTFQGTNRIGATNSDLREKDSGIWNADTRFTTDTTYDSVVKITDDDSANSFAGFKGMQFEGNGSGVVPNEITRAIFNSNLSVYDSSTLDSTPKRDDVKIKGVLYSLGNRTEFAKVIDKLFNWNQIFNISSWLYDSFQIDVSKVSRTNMNEAKKTLKELILNDDTTVPAVNHIPAEAFERNITSLVANPNASIFPGDGNPEPYLFKSDDETGNYSTAVITQFSQQDVIKLFDTNTNGKIDSEDKGINWSVASDPQFGFLGSSGEAFFMSAFDWYTTQTTYISSSRKEIFKRQGKAVTFDRRLNDAIGKDLLDNYKENKSSE
ncbi:MAG: DUF3713 domain-containing protein [Mycoplasma sp.]